MDIEKMSKKRGKSTMDYAQKIKSRPVYLRDDEYHKLLHIASPLTISEFLRRHFKLNEK